MRRDQLRGEPAEIEPLAAAENRRGNLLSLGGGEEKLHVLGWFLQRLQQCVEGRRREHVHLVDQVDFVRAAGRGISGVLAQRSDAVDAVVASAINLHHIETASLGDLDACVAGAAGIVRGPILACLTIERLREDAGGGGFSHAAGTDEEIGLGETLPGDRVLERPGDVFLTHDLLEALGAVFTGEDAVAHGRRKLKAAGGKVEGRRGGLQTVCRLLLEALGLACRR